LEITKDPRAVDNACCRGDEGKKEGKGKSILVG